MASSSKNVFSGEHGIPAGMLSRTTLLSGGDVRSSPARIFTLPPANLHHTSGVWALTAASVAHHCLTLARMEGQGEGQRGLGPK